MFVFCLVVLCAIQNLGPGTQGSVTDGLPLVAKISGWTSHCLDTLRISVPPLPQYNWQTVGQMFGIWVGVQSCLWRSWMISRDGQFVLMGVLATVTFCNSREFLLHCVSVSLENVPHFQAFVIVLSLSAPSTWSLILPSPMSPVLLKNLIYFPFPRRSTWIY